MKRLSEQKTVHEWLEGERTNEPNDQRKNSDDHDDDDDLRHIGKL